MAKKRNKNKTRNAAADSYMDEHPAALPIEIRAAMKKQGFNMTTQSISGRKNSRKNKTEAASNGAANKRQKQSNRRKKLHGVTAEGVRATRKFADRLGGTEALREHLEILEVAQG